MVDKYVFERLNKQGKGAVRLQHDVCVCMANYRALLRMDHFLVVYNTT